ncbi:MAG: hypothetical protein ABR519_00425, partial [Bacteroidales bacterium]
PGTRTPESSNQHKQPGTSNPETRTPESSNQQSSNPEPAKATQQSRTLLYNRFGGIIRPQAHKRHKALLRGSCAIPEPATLTKQIPIVNPLNYSILKNKFYLVYIINLPHLTAYD